MKRILQITAVIVLTVVFLYLFLRNADLRQVWRLIARADFAWITVAVAANILALVFRSLRWRTILDPDDPPAFYPTFFANSVGYAISTLLPVRAADVARPALLARRTDHRFSGALGTVLTERLLDLTTLLGLFLGFALFRWDDFEQNRSFAIVKAGAIASGAALAAILFFILGIWFYRDFVRAMHEWTGRIIPQRFRESWMHFFDTFVETLSIAQHRNGLVPILLYTGAIWFCLTSQFWLTANGLGYSLPWDSSIFVTGITTVGLAIPTPGGVGGFHKACQLVLTHFYRFDVDASVAVAVLFHLVGTVPVVATGLALIAHDRFRRSRDVTRRS